MKLDWDSLPVLFPGFARPGRWLPLLCRHWELIEAAAPGVSVTTVNGEDAVRRHYAESLESLRIAEHAGWEGSVADVGSGGGFPGLVIACLRPEVEVNLIEPLQKRARLLEDFAAELALSNVNVQAARAEDAARGESRERAGLVTARAVAELRVLLEYTAPLCAVGGLLAFPKGSGLAGEEASAAAAIEALGVERVGTIAMRAEISETLSVALFRKVKATDARYPRRAGVPERRPL